MKAKVFKKDRIGRRMRKLYAENDMFKSLCEELNVGQFEVM